MGLGLVSSGDMLLTVLSSLVVAAFCTLSLRWVHERDKLSDSGNLSLTVLVLNAADSVLDLGDLLLIVLRDKVPLNAYARALGLGWISKLDKPSLLSSLSTIISSLFIFL